MEEKRFEEFSKAITDLTISDELRQKSKIKMLEVEKTELEKMNQQNKIMKSEMEEIKVDLEKVKQWREIHLKFKKKTQN